jgi:hypothetical protein
VNFILSFLFNVNHVKTVTGRIYPFPPSSASPSFHAQVTFLLFTALSISPCNVHKQNPLSVFHCQPQNIPQPVPHASSHFNHTVNGEPQRPLRVSCKIDGALHQLHTNTDEDSCLLGYHVGSTAKEMQTFRSSLLSKSYKKNSNFCSDLFQALKVPGS